MLLWYFIFRTVQIWFQNTRNRRKRLANYLKSSNQKTSGAIDLNHPVEYSQTGPTSSSTAISESHLDHSTTSTASTSTHQYGSFEETKSPQGNVVLVALVETTATSPPSHNQPTVIQPTVIEESPTAKKTEVQGLESEDERQSILSTHSIERLVETNESCLQVIKDK